MNYNHSFHAGNFADVIKHLTLILFLEELQKNHKQFLVIDTHAGRGKYDLESGEALRTGEAKNGIFDFVKNSDPNHIFFKNYFKILAKINIWKNPLFNDERSHLKNHGPLGETEKLRFYPGSPYIIKYFLRDSDKAIFCDIQESEFALLRRNFAGNKKTEYYKKDGFEFLQQVYEARDGKVPTLILIDPAFEKNSSSISSDYQKIIATLKNIKNNFANSACIIWHPIINRENEQQNLQKFYADFRALNFENSKHFIYKDKDLSNKMSSCGLFVINASKDIEQKLNTLIK